MRRKRKPGPAKRRKDAAAPRARGEELKAAGRALLGREDDARRTRPLPPDDASVEDPLRDWPED